MSDISSGRLLRSNTRGCVVGCRVSRIPPALGSMVYIPAGDTRIFGVVHDIHIDDDGLVRQLAAAGSVPDEIVRDNRDNRNVPVEMSILFTGYEKAGVIFHSLPPRPPLSLDEMYICSEEDLLAFTKDRRFSYVRHILAEEDAPTGDLLCAHLVSAQNAQRGAGSPNWIYQALREIIILLRSDPARMSEVLGAVNDALPTNPRG